MVGSRFVRGRQIVELRVTLGRTGSIPDKPRVYLENTWVSCRFPQFCLRFCPRTALRLRETREFPEGNSRETEWSTKHPLVSLETSGNAKCWGPSGFPLGCRKPSYRPIRASAQADRRRVDARSARRGARPRQHFAAAVRGVRVGGTRVCPGHPSLTPNYS